MALATLGDLKESIADWLNRDDIDAVLEDFILMAQNRINKDIRSYTDNYPFSVVHPPNSQQNPIDDHTSLGISQVETFIVDDVVIPYVTNEEYWSELADPTVSSGVWTLLDGNIMYSKYTEPFGTPPITGNNVELYIIGQREVDALATDDTQDISSLVVGPEALLYASLVEASIYLRDAEGIQIYQPRYEELMDKHIKSFKRERVAGGMAVSSIGGDY